MRLKKLLPALGLAFGLTLGATGSLHAQELAVERVLTWYHLLRPPARDLAIYQLDWSNSIDQARKQAIAQRRPICLMIIHSKYGDIASGHC
jgi:hypothetical protein